jgi:drug/metabolite transporter (DMT)-like permease
MSVVAPITAVVGAGLPVMFGLATGERPGPAALVGIATGLLAVVVITRAPDVPAKPAADHDARVVASARHAIICAFGAGLGFGLFYILLQRSPADSGLWPLLGTRISLVSLLAIAVAVRRPTVGVSAGMGLRLLGLGLVNTVADLLFLLATREGLLSLVAVITSMYPAVTIGLAGILLGERTTRHQVIGLALAVISVALIAVG